MNIALPGRRRFIQSALACGAALAVPRGVSAGGAPVLIGFDAELREDVEEARAGISPLRDVRRWFAEEAPERFSAEERERDDEDFLACSKSTICACLLT